MKFKSNEQGRCPKCNSDSLQYESLNIDGDFIYYPWRCEQCGTSGEEWYQLHFTGHNVETEEGVMEILEVEKEVE